MINVKKVVNRMYQKKQQIGTVLFVKERLKQSGKTAQQKIE